MKILVTGANGFVGSHLCEELLKKENTVYALVRNKNKFKIDLPENQKVNLHLIQGSLDQSELNWINDLPNDLEACVHTAGIVHSFDEREFYRINAEASENLAKKLFVKTPLLHFILISSLAAAGPSISDSPRDEQEVPLPVSDYGRSKKLAEELVQKNTPDLALTIIRPPMVIGPRDLAVLDIFKMVKSRIIILPGLDSKDKKYSFVSVFDLVTTIILCLEKRKTGTFYSAYPDVATFKEIIEKIKKLFGYRIIFYIPLPLILAKLVAFFLAFLYRFIEHDIRLTPDKYHELAANNFTCRATKSEVELNQQYRRDLDRTLKEAFEDYKNKKLI